MAKLSPAGNQLVQNLSQRHGISTDAALHMLLAVQNGNGSMAQFNHPEFGGSGQWMRGGMTMTSDMFNQHLKNTVNNVCSDISSELANHQQGSFVGSSQSQSQNGSHSQMQASGGMPASSSLFEPDPEANWWPMEFGPPNAVGSQNDVRYAYFAQICRLAVKTGSDVWVYDTQHHQIGGFSQQQGQGGSITFSSQMGTVNLASLPVISCNGIAPEPPVPAAAPAHEPMAPEPCHNPSASVAPTPPAPLNPSPAPTQQATSSGGDSASTSGILETLDRLGELRDKGYVTDEEFAAKKADLLSRL